MKKKYVIGIGNYSMYDDSIGLRLIEAISERELDKDFIALDLSGNALNIFSYLTEDTERILLVDTAQMGLAPGDYRIFIPSKVTSDKQLSNITSHEGDMLKVLALAEQTGYPIPPIHIFAIEPHMMKEDFGLSDCLQGNFEDYLNKILQEIHRPL